MKAKITTKPALTFIFLALLTLALGFFWADMEILSDGITIILPYIIIMIAAVWFIGEKSGAFFALLSVCLWLVSKAYGFKRIDESILIDLAVKTAFIGIQYILIVQLKRMHERVKDSAILEEIGRILKSCVRLSDIAARIRESYRASCEARSRGTTLSIGVFSSYGSSTIEEMIIKADELME